MPIRGDGPASTTRAVLDLVARIIAAEDLETYARVACTGIRELIPALSVSYNEVNPQAQRVFAIIEPDPGPEWFARFQPPFERHLHDNPLVTYFSATPDTRPLAWGDPAVGHITGTALDGTFYLPNGIRSQLGLLLPAPPGIMIAFAVNRDERGFTPQDRQIMDLLRPHLIHAYRTVQLRADCAAFGSVLAHEGWAVVQVSDSGEIVATSPGTRAAAARFGLRLAEGSNVADGPLAGIQQHITGYDPATPAVPSPALRVIGPAGTLQAVVVPGRVTPHVVLIRQQADPVTAVSGLGLTSRQSEVALALARGATNQEIARALGVSTATIRKHLEHIYARLAVSHRAAAVAAINDACSRPDPSIMSGGTPGRKTPAIGPRRA